MSYGNNNILLGYRAGYNARDMTKCIIIGDQAQTVGFTSSNEIVIGNGISGKGTNTVYIGSYPNVNIYNSNNSTGWDVISDQRVKKNI